MRKLPMAGLVMAALIGCHADVADADKTCSVDDDCVVLAHAGCENPLCHCGPAYDAVNRESAAEYARWEMATHCPVWTPTTCECASGGAAKCESGVCELVTGQQ